MNIIGQKILVTLIPLLIFSTHAGAHEETLSRNFGLRSHQDPSELPVSKAAPGGKS